MKKNEVIEALATHEVFSDLDSKEIESIYQISDIISIGKDEALFKLNELPKYLFLVTSGNFTLYFPNNDELEIRKGDIIGEVGLLNGDFRLGELKANEDSQLVRICGTRIFSEKFISPKTSLKVIRILSKRITDYLRSRQQISSRELISKGESDAIEFKSTIRWNLYTNKKDKAIEHSILKTLVAFLNSKGGQLLIGVSDNGQILGIENDRFENDDKLLLHLTNLIKNHIGSLYLLKMDIHIEKLADHKIVRIDCVPSQVPAYVKDGKMDYFYVRTGPSSTNLRVSKIYDYIRDRF